MEQVGGLAMVFGSNLITPPIVGAPIGVVIDISLAPGRGDSLSSRASESPFGQTS